MDNRVSLYKGLQFTKAKVVAKYSFGEKPVKYTVGAALKEIGFDKVTNAYVYKCQPDETIFVDSFRNSYSKVRIAIPTIMDATTFLYEKLRMCFNITKRDRNNCPIYRYSIGIVIPVEEKSDKKDDEENCVFFPILEHKGYSFTLDNEITDALIKLCELVKKYKR